MIVTSNSPIFVNGLETSEFTGDLPLTITQVQARGTTVRLTNDLKTSAVSKIGDAQEHKISSGASILVVLKNRELKVYERNTRKLVRTRLTRE